MIDFEKAIADVGICLVTSNIHLPCDSETLGRIFSTLDAAKKENARLTNEREAWKSAFDDLQAESNTQLARLTAELEQSKVMGDVSEALNLLDAKLTDHALRGAFYQMRGWMRAIEADWSRLTALSEQQDRVQKELPERIVAFLEEAGVLLQEYSEYGDLLIDVQPKHFAEIIAAAMEAAKEE